MQDTTNRWCQLETLNNIIFHIYPMDHFHYSIFICKSKCMYNCFSHKMLRLKLAVLKANLNNIEKHKYRKPHAYPLMENSIRQHILQIPHKEDTYLRARHFL